MPRDAQRTRGRRSFWNAEGAILLSGRRSRRRAKTLDGRTPSLQLARPKARVSEIVRSPSDFNLSFVPIYYDRS